MKRNIEKNEEKREMTHIRMIIVPFMIIVLTFLLVGLLSPERYYEFSIIYVFPLVFNTILYSFYTENKDCFNIKYKLWYSLFISISLFPLFITAYKYF